MIIASDFTTPQYALNCKMFSTLSAQRRLRYYPLASNGLGGADLTSFLRYVPAGKLTRVQPAPSISRAGRRKRQPKSISKRSAYLPHLIPIHIFNHYQVVTSTRYRYLDRGSTKMQANNTQANGTQPNNAQAVDDQATKTAAINFSVIIGFLFPPLPQKLPH